MTPFRIRMIYTLYALSAGIVFVFVLFPSEIIKKAAINRVKRVYPPYQVRIASIAPTLPCGIQITGLTLTKNNEPTIHVALLELMPKLLSLIRGRLSVRFEGQAYGGVFKGEMDFTDGDWARPEKLDLHVADLRMNETALKAIEGAPLLSGTLDGKVRYALSETAGDDCDVDLSLTAATLSLPALSERMEKLMFKKVEAAFFFHQQTLKFRRFIFSGPQLEGTIAGTVRFADPIGKSRLSLQLLFSIQPEYSETVSQLVPVAGLLNTTANREKHQLQIFGTLDSPSFSFTR